MTRCASCKCVLDASGCDDAEKHDQGYPDHCRGCAVRLHEVDSDWRIHSGRRDWLDVGDRRFTLRPGEARALRAFATNKTKGGELLAKLREIRS